MRVSYIALAKMYVTMGMLGTVVLDQQVCLFKMHPASVYSTCTRPADQPSLPQGQQTYLPLRVFDYVAQNQHTCL